MRLKATELTIAPRHPIIDEKTGATVGWKHGKVFAGNTIEWRGPLEQAPHSLVAIPPGEEGHVPGDAETLQAARDAAAARRRLANRDRMKDALRSELRAELEQEAREEAKRAMRDEAGLPEPEPVKRNISPPRKGRTEPFATPDPVTPQTVGPTLVKAHPQKT